MRLFILLFLFITTGSTCSFGQQNLPLFDQLQQNVWYLPTDDGQSRLYVTSIGQGNTVVTLHGGPGNNFIYLADALRANTDDHTFILFDQRGSLLSPVPENQISSLSIDSLVKDLETLRQSLNQEKMVLFGHSFGSLLAMQYYMKYPDHVKGMILTASVPPFMTDSRPFSSQLKGIHARLKKLRSRKVIQQVLEREGLNKKPEQLSAKEQWNRFKITGLASFNLIDVSKWRKLKGGGVYYDRNVDSAIGSTIPDTYDIRPVLEKHPISITVIQGDKDYIDPAARSWKELLDNYKQVQLKVIEEASHYSWVDDKQAFDAALRKALSRIEQ